jgi:histidinol dehydrogenase
MVILHAADNKFNESIQKIFNRAENVPSEVEETVNKIINDIKLNGDSALVNYTQKFDGHDDILITEDELKNARSKVDKKVYDALETAFRRIKFFHEKQISESWKFEQNGEVLGQIISPLERTGIYVPGGKAVYPSSVLMNAVPAIVAGVEEIIMVTPDNGNGVNPVILAAAEMCGIKKAFKIGGAQAVAALAYGTETVPSVDKIVGPGNIYVAMAKKHVFGKVDIDMIAGPSEILIISDGTGSAECVAADMLSQAEHDEMASSILITTDENFAREVEKQIYAQLEVLPKKDIAIKSIENYGAIIIVDDLTVASEISNKFAPEHLELYVNEPWELLVKIKNAGAVFLGHYTPEALGDYIAGPNHVLPTGGTARFFSPLSVDDFVKKTSLLSFTKDAFNSCAEDVITLATSEELEAHARSVKKRLRR